MHPVSRPEKPNKRVGLGKRLRKACLALLGAADGKDDRHACLLYAVNRTAAVLLASSEENFEASLQEGMTLMARCMDVDRIYIWRNEIKDGTLYYVPIFEWLGGAGQKGTIIRKQKGYAYSESLAVWEDLLGRGLCVNGPVKALSAVERQRLEPYGIQSILVVPVHLRDRFAGFVSFDDCRRERAFGPEEVSILRSASLMMASALIRNEATARMREADERAKLMLDATPLCCSLWDADCAIIDCNEEAVKLFELSSKEEYLARFHELAPPFQPDGRPSVETCAQYVRQAFAQGRHVFEWVHQKLDGTPIPAEVTLVRVKRAEEYIVAGYIRDLREHKRMMEEIERRDAMLRTVNSVATLLLQSEPNEFERTLWRCMRMLAEAAGADRVYICQNRRQGGRLYGAQLYEWPGGAEQSRGPGATADIPGDEIPPQWEKALSQGQCINAPVHDLPSPGRARLSLQGVLAILMVPVFVQEKFWGFVRFDDCRRGQRFTRQEMSILRSGSLLMASALLRNETTLNLRTALAKLEAVVANYTGVIWSVDKKNVITLFRGLHLKERGMTPSLLEGKTLDEAQALGRYDDIIGFTRKTFTNGPQERMVQVDDRMFRFHTMPILDSQGRITGVVGSLDDITDTVHLQKELEAAVFQAQAASQAKSSFLSNMSHEIRTPLNAISGMTLIGKSAASSERKDYAFGKIEEASNHLLGIINDILDMSKIEANKFELSAVEFSFERLLQRVVNVSSFRAGEKRQRFTVYLDSAIPPMLIGDDQRLAQVVTNLLSNAVKFTPPEGSIRLDARLAGEEDGMCALKIAVTDSGIGISPEQQSRLFLSFEQAESSTSRKFGGTGLGLSISKHIVELMGGEIGVSSKLGKGSTFTFTVRLKRGNAKEGLLSPGVNWRNIRVLVVDDQADTREYFAGIAAHFGLACDTAASAPEALARIETGGPYDMFFIDWSMPGVNGIELARRVKARLADRSVIIMISAMEWTRIEAEAMSAGVDQFLSKPLFPSDIMDCINRCIGVEENVEMAQPAENALFPGRRILLAEDLEINREIVQAMLEPSRLVFDCAANGAEALRLFSEAPDRYDLILMDVQMPEMDGLEATRRIRALGFSKAKEIPIVAMTANVFKEDVEKCLAAGMSDHVGKPLDYGELQRILSKHLIQTSS